MYLNCFTHVVNAIYKICGTYYVLGILHILTQSSKLTLESSHASGKKKKINCGSIRGRNVQR